MTTREEAVGDHLERDLVAPRCGGGSRDSPCECPRQCDVCDRYRAVDGPVCEECWDHAEKCSVCTEYPVKKRGDVCRECDLEEVR